MVKADDKIIYLPYKEAKGYIHNLHLQSLKEWKKYCSSGNKPSNIPSTPDMVYKNNDWINWYEWLGTEKIEYLQYKEARNYVRKLNLRVRSEWEAYCKGGKKPRNIPATPDSVYKNTGWANWHEWLGTQKMEYKKARDFVHKLQLRNSVEWDAYCNSGNKPINIPAKPYRAYKDKGLINLYDWLGTSPKTNIKRPKIDLIDGVPAEEFYEQNADPIALFQNGDYELLDELHN